MEKVSAAWTTTASTIFLTEEQAHDAGRGPRLGGGESFLPVVEPATTGTARSRWSSRRNLGEMGVFGPPSRANGCAGLETWPNGLNHARSWSAGDLGACARSPRLQSGLVMYPIHSYGSDAQKDRWLPRLQSGEAPRLLRPHRARPRLRSRLDEDAERSRRATSTLLNGTKALDHQRLGGGRGGGLGQGRRRRDRRLPGWRRGRPGYSTLDIHGKFSHARLDHLRSSRSRTAAIPLENKLPG